MIIGNWELYLVGSSLGIPLVSLIGMSLGNSIGYLLGFILISIGVVLGLDLVNYFDTSIGSLHFSSVDMTIGIMIGALMGTLLENYLGSSIEAFLGT